MKTINKDDNKHNDGSGTNIDNDVKDYGDDSYSNHHEISNDKDDNDNDNTDNNDQIMNAKMTLHIGEEDF